ncbi:HAD family hydrolase [Streptococcus mutans]|uniref:HAD family hydrolase n=2 Tax=Streptococcus mutans TaxID=1309 RepID=UPI0002EA6D24|nr:HAD hydrolase family protein [Streptococcus mutans]
MFISFVDCIQNIEKIEKELLKIGITDIQINQDQDGYINSLYWLKVKYPNANKGDAITFIKNHVACDYTVSFGNETNDIEMFLASDISICVVNAYNVIKDIADYGKISITIADDILELFEKEYHRYLENVVIALPEDKIIIENVLYMML